MSMTANDPAVVDANEFTVRRAVTIHAPLEKVWEAVTDPQHISAWFSDSAEVELVVGGEGNLAWKDHGSYPLVVERIEAPRLVAYRWSFESGGAIDLDHSTVFTFTLEPLEIGTQLTVVETGFDSLDDPGVRMESNRGGWTEELDELVAYLEGGS